MNYVDLAFILSNGATTSRTFGDRDSDILNVKDFGAVGDGVADDGPAIQACFDAAFGTLTVPHGLEVGWLNYPVFFPAGTYNTDQQLIITRTDGAWIFGAGMDSTKIVYTGPLDASGPGGVTYCIMGRFIRFCTIEGISFEFPSYTQGVNTGDPVCFGSINGTATPLPDLDLHAGYHNVWVNCSFQNAVVGIIMGFLATNTGSEHAFYGCHLKNCQWGYRVALNQNAIDFSCFGGVVEECLQGFSMTSGNFNITSGVTFRGNLSLDIYNEYADPVAIIGCTSTSTCQGMINVGETYMSGCTWGSSSRVVTQVVGTVIMDGNKAPGTIVGDAGGRLYLVATTNSVSSGVAGYHGSIPQNI